MAEQVLDTRRRRDPSPDAEPVPAKSNELVTIFCQHAATAGYEVPPETLDLLRAHFDQVPRGRSFAKNETDPVGSPPDVGVTTAFNPTGCPKRESAGTELVTRVTVVTAGAPPISPSSSACE